MARKHRYNTLITRGIERHLIKENIIYFTHDDILNALYSQTDPIKASITDIAASINTMIETGEVHRAYSYSRMMTFYVYTPNIPSKTIQPLGDDYDY